MSTRLEFYLSTRGKEVKIEHGTPSGYRHGCRCDECKAANREQQQAARDRRLNRPIPEHVHGTWNGYANYNCRCDRCLDACRARYPEAAAYREVNRDKLNERRREYYKESGK